MRTRRLYYQDQYCHTFRAAVISVRPGWVELDQTAFYPEGGGQPADHGWLNGFAVTDTQLDSDGGIWHQVAEPLEEGVEVSGKIDWRRRFDHMQQHTGQHVLSQAFWQLFDGATVGFHLGEQVVTVDIDRCDFTEAQLQQAEELTNAVIRSKRQVNARFVTSDQLPLEGLRKLPQVTSDIRLVAIDGFDICPCGGTHVRDLGEIGLLKLLSWEKRRGNLRISFICGQRAYADYREKHRTLQQLSALLSQPIPDVATGVERLLERLTELEKRVKGMREAVLEQEANRLAAAAEPMGKAAVVCREFSARQLDETKDLALLLANRGGIVVACGLPAEPYRLLLAVSAGLGLHAGNLLKQVVQAHGGKGGGAPLLGQGAVPATCGEQALRALRQAVLTELEK